MNILHTARCALLGALVMLPLAPALAGEVSTIINGRSFHLGATEHWNENNYGLGVEYEFATETRWKKRLMANAFLDSNEEMSYMAGGGLHRNLLSTGRLMDFYIDAGINVFVMTRQDVNDNRPFPAALPSLTVGNRYVGVNLTYLPAKAVEKFNGATMVDESISGIVFLQLKMNFGQIAGAD
jgi:hypothetical protein